jgi:hypothetical protein
MFGSSRSGNFAVHFTAFAMDIFHEVFKVLYFGVYVKIFDNIVPPLPSI